MPSHLVRRGGSILRTLPVNGAFPQPVRVVASQHHTRRITFTARRPLSHLTTPSVPRLSFIEKWARRYTTDESLPKGRGRPKGAKTQQKPTEKPAKKPAKKKPGRKPASKTETQKREAEAKRNLIQNLKKTALEPPKPRPNSWWVLAVERKFSEVRGLELSNIEAFKKAMDLAKAISDEERKELSEIASANSAANKADFKAWVLSHTPIQILEANKARRTLTRLNGKQRCLTLEDDRLLKKPHSSYIYFFKEKVGENDHPETVPEIAKRISTEWNGLSESAKEKYNQMAREARERYEQEHMETYGVAPPGQKGWRGLREQ
ncbi:hypothetical protein BJX99DRAFT_254859 [Aspergillus californicus]